MLFNTATYLIFLPIVFALYWTMRSCRSQNLVLLLASMVFYGWWSVPCLGLMVATCLLNYLFVLLMQRRRHRKPWLILSLLLNFGVLGIFKYFNFFAENLAVLLNTVGIRADMPTLNIILPVGISFYTFQLSGYVIDVYKKQFMDEYSRMRMCTHYEPVYNVGHAPRQISIMKKAGILKIRDTIEWARVEKPDNTWDFPEMKKNYDRQNVNPGVQGHSSHGR